MGAAMKTANIATGGAAMAGKVIMGTAAGTMGSASAIQAAFQKVSASMGSGGDMPSMGFIGGSGGDGSSDVAGFSDEAGQCRFFILRSTMPC